LNKIRIKFSRETPIKYISHLDILKVFERSMRRAGIKMLYTQGFNPHPKMVFGLPLSVGVISESEYADIEVNEYITPEDFRKKLNLNLPDGVRVLKAGYNNNNKSKIMAEIKAAKYSIYIQICKNKGDAIEELKSFMKKEEILSEKKTKNGMKLVNIKPLIYDFSITDNMDGDLIIIDMLVKAGQENNLKPQLLINVLPFEIDEVEIKRKALFVMLNKTLVEPMNISIIGN